MVIGVTGNVASGKSVAAGFLKEILGGTVVDADALGRFLLESHPDVQKMVRLEFGADVVDLFTDEIDRKKLSRFVFSSPDNLTRLNRIFYPYMIYEVRMAVLKARKVFSHVMVDAALIVEWNFQADLDYLVCVTAKPGIRVRRLMENRRLLEDDAENMVSAQASEGFKASVSDFVIRNEGSLEELRAEAEKTAKKILEKERAKEK